MNPNLLVLEIEIFFERLQLGDFSRTIILEAIDRYIEHKRQNYHPNQNSKELDISTRPWDELRKFKTMVQKSS